jgi:hypothetical protein
MKIEVCSLDDLNLILEEFEPNVLTTNNQFKALNYFLDEEKIIEDLITLNKFKKQKQIILKNEIKGKIKILLQNSWNTELLLNKNLEFFEELNLALHWGFPQAYYSVFSNLSALYKVLNRTSTLPEYLTHKKAIKTFGELTKNDYFPEKISFYSSGIRSKQIYNNIIRNTTDFNPCSSFYETDKNIIQTQISSLLKATRNFQLEKLRNEKLKEIKKKRLKKELEEKLSENLGITTILNFLYRKRIKANYDDIDTLLSNQIQPKLIFNSLIKIVRILNMLSESYILKIIGPEEYRDIIKEIKIKDKTLVNARFEYLNSLIFENTKDLNINLDGDK